MGKKDTEELSISLIDYDLEGMDISGQEQARKEIKDTRERLGEFSLGFMTEAIYGESYAKVFRERVGDDVFNMKMKNVQTDVSVVDGGVRTTLSEEMMKKLGVKTEDAAKLQQQIQGEAPKPKNSKVSALEKLADMDPAKLKKLMKLAEALEED